MTTDELIAALEAAPVGTRELGVAVLKAVGCQRSVRAWWCGQDGVVLTGNEHLVVTDLNFRLPGVPEGFVEIKQVGMPGEYAWYVDLIPHDSRLPVVYARAHTERLARCVAELKATLAVKGKEP